MGLIGLPTLPLGSFAQAIFHLAQMSTSSVWRLGLFAQALIGASALPRGWDAKKPKGIYSV